MQSVTLNIPDALFSRLQRTAHQSSRTVEAELLDVLFGAFSLSSELSGDLQSEIAAIALLDDETLRQAAQSRLTPEAARELESLHAAVDLSDAQRQAKASLVRQYERNMLVRAKAIAILKERGHDISSLLTNS